MTTGDDHRQRIQKQKGHHERSLQQNVEEFGRKHSSANKHRDSSAEACRPSSLSRGSPDKRRQHSYGANKLYKDSGSEDSDKDSDKPDKSRDRKDMGKRYDR